MASLSVFFMRGISMPLCVPAESLTSKIAEACADAPVLFIPTLCAKAGVWADRQMAEIKNKALCKYEKQLIFFMGLKNKRMN